MPLIVIEGIGGSGKTTLARALTERLKLIGKKTSYWREPGGNIGIAETIRSLIPTANSPTSRFFLFMAARSVLVDQIKPLLAAKEWVVLDRFTPSTLAYQGQWVDEDSILRIDQAARQGVSPDLVLWLDIPVGQALARLNLLDKADLALFEKPEILERAAGRYQRQYDLDQAARQIWRRLDASRPADEVMEQAINRLVVLLATGKLSPHT